MPFLGYFSHFDGFLGEKGGKEGGQLLIHTFYSGQF